MALPSPVSEATAKPYGGKLCEGYDAAWETKVGYVVQGAKLWFAYGKETQQGKQLTESLNDHATIVESIDNLELIEESDGKKTVKGGIWFVEGPAQRSDVINANKRIYGRKIWERLIANPKSPVQECIKARGMLGHIEHPKDGRTDGNLGAWVVVESKLLEDGVVWNKYELLDTPAGKILQEYTKKGVRYGSSSRGNGSVGEDGRVNETDFMVETWDAVMRPSTPGAYPVPVGSVKEGAQSSGAPATRSAGEMTEEAKACYTQVKALVETVVEGADDAARTKLAAGLIGKLGEVDNLTKSGAMAPAVAYDLRAWLTKRLSESIQVPAAVLESQIDRALTTGTDKTPDKQKAAFNRVIESFRTRMTACIEEAAELRRKLHEAQAALTEATDEVTTLKSALTESQAETSKVQAQLDVATNVLAEQSDEASSDVVKAVEEAIREYPALSQHQTKLAASASMGEFTSLLESLLPDVMSRPVGQLVPAFTVPASAGRRSLPRGNVISEGITAQRSDLTVATPGSRMAAKMVKRISPPTPS